VNAVSRMMGRSGDREKDGRSGYILERSLGGDHFIVDRVMRMLAA
jgi:hypothetical protein